MLCPWVTNITAQLAKPEPGFPQKVPPGAGIQEAVIPLITPDLCAALQGSAGEGCRESGRNLRFREGGSSVYCPRNFYPGSRNDSRNPGRCPTASASTLVAPDVIRGRAPLLADPPRPPTRRKCRATPEFSSCRRAAACDSSDHLLSAFRAYRNWIGG